MNCGQSETGKMAMLRKVIESIAIVTAVFFGATLGQLEKWIKDGPVEYYASPNATEQNFTEANATCARLESRLAMIETLRDENTTIDLIRDSGRRFYIGLQAKFEISRNDGSAVSQRQLQGLKMTNATTRECVYVRFEAEDSGLIWSFQDCSKKTGFLCERDKDWAATTVNTQEQPGVESKATGPKSTKPNRYHNDVTTNFPEVEGVVFWFHLGSFLLGFIIPIPFLLAAIIKIAWPYYRSQKKVPGKTNNSLNEERHSLRNDGIESAAEITCEPTYVNLSGAAESNFANSGYEQPISSNSQEYVEPATYEEYQYENHDTFA